MARMGTFTDAAGVRWKFWNGRWRKAARAVPKGTRRSTLYRKPRLSKLVEGRGG